MTDILTFKFLFRREEEKKDSLTLPQFPQTTEVNLPLAFELSKLENLFVGAP